MTGSMLACLPPPAPTLVWDDKKELPNVPLSAINGSMDAPPRVAYRYCVNLWRAKHAIPLGGPVAGLISLNLQVR